MFERSVRTIKRAYDLDLTLIEKARLKELVNNSISELEALAAQCEKPSRLSYTYVHWKFDPSREAVTRFMMVHYDLLLNLQSYTLLIQNQQDCILIIGMHSMNT